MPTTLPMSHSSSTQTQSVNVIAVLAGIWLIIAPFIFSYSSNGGSTSNDVILGIAVIILAGIQMAVTMSRQSWPSWINALLGLWLIISPFALGYPSGSAAMWNDIILGLIVGISALVSVAALHSDETTA